MKYAQLNKGEELVKEVVIILDPWEADHVARAMAAYANSKRKNKKLAALCSDLELASMFY